MTGRSRLGTAAFTATFGVVLASLFSACANDPLRPIDQPTLLTWESSAPDGNYVDSAWGGVIDASQECVVNMAGPHRSVLIAPAGSTVMENPETGDLHLRVDGEDHPFNANYVGGGVSVSGESEYGRYPGASECLEATDATELLVIFTIEPA